MKQPGVIVTLIVFIAAVSFVLAAQQEKGRTLTIQLSGVAESPLQGDVDGKGVLKLSVKPNENKICYDLTVTNLSSVSSIQIHSGAAGHVGPTVFELNTTAHDVARECGSLDHELAMDMVRNPENYYATVVNAEFPDGALRGQLFR